MYSVTAYKQDILAKYRHLRIQETSLEAHIRDVTNRKSGWKPPVCEEVVDNLGMFGTT